MNTKEEPDQDQTWSLKSTDLNCGGVERMGQRGHQGHHPQGRAGPLGSGCGSSGAAHFQGGDQGVVTGHAHGGEEENAGVHVHGGDRAHDLAHDPAEGPAEVQHRVHGPEGQGEDELQVGDGQAHHEAVDGRVVVTPAARVEQEEGQEVTHKPQDTHHQVDQSDENPHLSDTHQVSLNVK